MKRRLIVAWLGSSLVLGVSFLSTGCGTEPGQPDRGSISAPRKGGGMEDPGPAKGKAAGKAGGKAGGKGGDL
jgi:hypothetical protein